MTAERPMTESVSSRSLASIAILQQQGTSDEPELLEFRRAPTPSRHTSTSSHSSDTWQYNHTHTHTHPFNGPLSDTTRVSWYQKGKTYLDFTEARGSDISWAICKSAPRSRQITTSALSFLQAGCPSCRPTNSIKALKAISTEGNHLAIQSHHKISTLISRCHHNLPVNRHLLGKTRLTTPATCFLHQLFWKRTFDVKWA